MWSRCPLEHGHAQPHGPHTICMPHPPAQQPVMWRRFTTGRSSDSQKARFDQEMVPSELSDLFCFAHLKPFWWFNHNHGRLCRIRVVLKPPPPQK